MKKKIIKTLKWSCVVFIFYFTTFFFVVKRVGIDQGYFIPGSHPAVVVNLSFKETWSKCLNYIIVDVLIATFLTSIFIYNHFRCQEKREKQQPLIKGILVQIENTLVPFSMLKEESDRDNNKDVIIKAIANTMNERFSDIYINLSYQKNVHINNSDPDIVITQKKENIVNQMVVVFAEKEELYADTDKLKTLSSLGGNFFIIIPIHLKEEVEKYCRECGITAYVRTYIKEEDANVIVNW